MNPNSDFLKILKNSPANWQLIEKYFSKVNLQAKSIVLAEGEIAKNIYFIESGALRMWFNNNGTDVTFQFFFENSGVASIESFLAQKPSLFYIESIEPSTLVVLTKKGFDEVFRLYPELKDGFQKILYERFSNYANLFLSRIKDKPLIRYKELLKSHPEIIQRVPQHYIASYLGITPVSLSRIRNKI